jgi:hypothetical protein
MPSKFDKEKAIAYGLFDVVKYLELMMNAHTHTADRVKILVGKGAKTRLDEMDCATAAFVKVIAACNCLLDKTGKKRTVTEVNQILRC